MIYVEISGRMGNQMFSYAMARSLQRQIPRQQDSPIAFDFSRFQRNRNDVGWENALVNYKCSTNIVEDNRKMSIIQRLLLKAYFSQKNRKGVIDTNRNELDRFERKWRDFLVYFGIYLCSFNYHEFKIKPMAKNILIMGWYESPKYFDGIDDVLKKEFKPIDMSFNNDIMNMIDDIENCESVCVGIRRGDFQDQNNREYCFVCDESYYEKAIKKMENIVKSAKFYFFTDDPDWVKEQLNLPSDSVVVGDNLTKYDNKLYIMSLCKHFIISNSSYVWWSQHLSENPNKKVIAPDRWRNYDYNLNTDIYEDNWIII